MATIKPAIPDVPLQVERALLEIFRQIANKKFVAQKGRKSKELMHVDVKVHLAKYISEFVSHLVFNQFFEFLYFRLSLVFYRVPKVCHVCDHCSSI